jgi:nucleotide-binding universal stress UspA family protein
MSADERRNILLAVDLAQGEPAWHVSGAAEVARELVRDRADHVIVLHVREFAVSRLMPMMIEHGGADGQRAVNEIVSALRTAGVNASGLVREADTGHVAQAILDASAEFGARFIVLGSARRRVPLGSVANYVARFAEVPVVTVARTRSASLVWPVAVG